MVAHFAVFGVVGTVGIIVILLVFLLLFGNRLPALMRGLGGSMIEFKKGVQDIDEEDKSRSK